MTTTTSSLPNVAQSPSRARTRDDVNENVSVDVNHVDLALDVGFDDPDDEPLLLTEPVAIHPIRGRPATVLIVDCDTVVRWRHRRKLVTAGYEVREAPDARTAYRYALEKPVDAILVDASMPDVDGWGLLSVFRDDLRLAETKVVLMCAQRSWLHELSRLRIGADGFVAKDGDVVGAIDNALSRRLGILGALPQGAWGPLSDVGVQALLASACEARLCAMLSVDDGVTTWRVFFDDGFIASARATAGSTVQTDIDALRSLLQVPDAPFTFDKIDAPPERTLEATWNELAPALCGEINEQRATTRSQVLSLPRSVLIDRERMRCWARNAPPTSVQIARALASGQSPRDLAEHARVREQVEAIVRDLVRRGVVQLSP